MQNVDELLTTYLNSLTCVVDDFWEYHLLDGEILGYGIIVPNVLLKKYWTCGMITLKQYRTKGVGRSIQIHLGDICRENNKIPISGSWYYNDLSRKTIESAGKYTTTRLLNVIF